MIETKLRGAQVAVFAVHEFVGNDFTDQKKLDTNRGDFEDFARLLLQNPEATITSEKLYGPVQVPEGEFIPNDIPLYLGKTRPDGISTSSHNKTSLDKETPADNQY